MMYLINIDLYFFKTFHHSIAMSIVLYYIA